MRFSIEQLRDFFSELRRRRVVKTGIWYVGGSITVLGAASQIFFPAFGVDLSLLRPLTIIAIFGLPVALTLSWEFDVYAADRSSEHTHAPWFYLVPLVVIFGVALSGVIHFIGREERSIATPIIDADPAHIAVLPFSAETSDADMTSFGGQLQRFLIDALTASSAGVASERKLTVSSNEAVAPYMKSPQPLPQLRRDLRVGTVLSGSVEAVGDAVRVHIRLVDTQTGVQLASKMAEARIGKRVALVNAVSDSVLALVRRELRVTVRARFARLRTKDDHAYNLYSRAMQRTDEYNRFPKDNYAQAHSALDQIDDYLAQAQKLDRHWVDPVIARGYAEYRRALLDRSRPSSERRADIERGLKHADRALRIAPGSYEALQLRGGLKRMLMYEEETGSKQWTALAESAERDLLQALADHPAPAPCYRLLSEIASERGNLQEALLYGTEAFDRDPYSQDVEATILRLAEYSLQLGQDSVALHWCAMGRARFSTTVFDDCRLVLGAWSQIGLRSDSALLMVRHAISNFQGSPPSGYLARLWGMYAAVLAKNHMNDSARAVFARARRFDSTSIASRRLMVGMFLVLNEPDSARAVVSRSLRADPHFLVTSQHSPEMRALKLR